MRIRLSIALLASIVLLAGCATPQQAPIGFTKASASAEAGRIGVIMTAMPELDTQVPGAGCLLCVAFAVASNSALTTHVKTLGYEDLPQLKNEAAAALRKSGATVVVIDELLNLEKLPSHTGTGTNVAPLSYGAFKQKYQIDKLLVLNVAELGFVRNYANYVPVSDPKGLFKATGYLVKLDNNSYEWYESVVINKASDQQWDEPPRFPGLTNAYYQALEMGKDSLIKPLFASGDAVRTKAAAAASKTTATLLAAPAVKTGQTAATPAAAQTAAIATMPAAAPATATAALKLAPMDVNTGKKPQAGDEWEYLASDKLFGKRTKLVWRIKSVEANGVTEELIVDGHPPHNWVFNGEPVAIGAPIDMGFIFGQHWNGQTRLPNMKIKGQLGDCIQRMECTIEDSKVTRTERITIAAGTFDAVRIDGNLVLSHLAIRPSGRISVWYSERDRRLLKQTASMRNASRVFDETVELQAARSYR